MLLNLREYHRPLRGSGQQGLDQAVQLLARPDIRTLPMGGGDALVGSSDPTIEAVVDLQGLGLDIVGTDPEEAALRIGAMVTRSALARSEEAAAFCSGLIVQAARRWSGSVQRNRATVGGAVATAAGDDPLVAALLACDATVSLYGMKGAHTLSLADFLSRPRDVLAAPALITEVIVPAPEPHTAAAIEGVARTPADAPIVLAAAMLTVREKTCLAARLALAGVADVPLLVTDVESLLAHRRLTADLIADAADRAAASLHPADDYRGSAEYRRAMAEVLARRALDRAWSLCC